MLTRIETGGDGSLGPSLPERSQHFARTNHRIKIWSETLFPSLVHLCSASANDNDIEQHVLGIKAAVLSFIRHLLEASAGELQLGHG